ncbi:N-acetylmuramoyl-L-alanine amidase [Lysobacter sp. TAF61]|uniref:N-acetylmuramoyl-L-alanine amidase n=1 Tax=Lysobacter sp. TAF61 TaxID=3233072 RepID=UPI003F943F79
MRAVVATLAIAMVLAGCATAPPAVPNPAPDWRPSLNYDGRSAQMIIIHQTEMESAEAALLTLQTSNSSGRVSAHYLIGKDGHLYQLVAESQRAWHAGASRWGGVTDLNSGTIGIELDNDGVAPFSTVQIDTLLRLLDNITGRLDIPRHLVIGHGDIAPARKRDPSALFPWQRLAEAGFGLWPRPQPVAVPDGFDPWVAMRLVGYDLRDPAAAVRAFHRHYRGNEDEQWLPGDAEILRDLELQLMEMPLPEVAP